MREVTFDDHETFTVHGEDLLAPDLTRAVEQAVLAKSARAFLGRKKS